MGPLIDGENSLRAYVITVDLVDYVSAHENETNSKI